MAKKMSRTTIMADDALLDRLRTIAKEEGVSLGAVIREGLEWRVRMSRRGPPSFIGAVDSDGSGGDTAERAEELLLEYYRTRDTSL